MRQYNNYTARDKSIQIRHKMRCKDNTSNCLWSLSYWELHIPVKYFFPGFSFAIPLLNTKWDLNNSFEITYELLGCFLELTTFRAILIFNVVSSVSVPSNLFTISTVHWIGKLWIVIRFYQFSRIFIWKCWFPLGSSCTDSLCVLLVNL